MVEFQSNLTQNFQTFGETEIWQFCDLAVAKICPKPITRTKKISNGMHQHSAITMRQISIS
jgi:hypothetical protein